MRQYLLNIKFHREENGLGDCEAEKTMQYKYLLFSLDVDADPQGVL